MAASSGRRRDFLLLPEETTVAIDTRMHAVCIGALALSTI